MDEAVAAIAAHLGVVNEDEINNMSMVFFQNVLTALGKKLNYESISNIYGNSFAKDAGKYVKEAYPLIKKSKMSDFAKMLNMAAVKTIKKNAKPEDKVKAISKDLGDLSWAEGLI